MDPAEQPDFEPAIVLHANRAPSCRKGLLGVARAWPYGWGQREGHPSIESDGLQDWWVAVLRRRTQPITSTRSPILS